MIIDSIDLTLMAAIESHSGQCMADVLRGFTLVGESQSYCRIRQLAAGGFVELDRTSRRGKVFCHISAAGKNALAEAQTRT